ncbi:glucose/sorbosone dehydrogenase [Saccharomonospora azurea SZMC 14600]|nr:glucose/sorbosone dehydrogenase [Saccharomonospora azurea SZMC 14600]
MTTGLGAGGFVAAADQKTQHEEGSVLVFSKTAGFRHDSIPAGIEAIERLGAEHHFSVEATEDAAAFTDDNLAGYDAVVWLSTTGDVLNDEQQAAFERYVEGAGVTSACTPRPTPSTTGRGTATSWVPGSTRTRTSRKPPSRSRTPTIRPQRTFRNSGCAPTSGTTTARTPGRTSACSPRSTRAATTRAPARWATIPSPGATRTAVAAPGTRAADIPSNRSRSRSSSPTSPAASPTRRDSPTPTAARRVTRVTTRRPTPTSTRSPSPRART